MSKNKLQEYCQKVKLPLPTYEYIRSISREGKNDPAWICIGKISNYQATSQPCSNKTEASMEAAKILLRMLENPIEIEHSSSEQSKEVKTYDLAPVVVVDLENQPLKLVKNNFIYMLFCSDFSTIDLAKYNDFNIYKIDSAIPEAVDHYITYVIARMVGSKVYTPDKHMFVICSKDKSSAILVKLLQNDGFKVIHCRSQQDYDCI